MELFRPVGLLELRLVAGAAWRRFPPRLPEQPIFYPVLEEDYAVQIARDWNTADRASGYAGFVTRFELRDEVAERYPVQLAGAAVHRELWVPAEELEDFQEAFLGPIELRSSYYGPRFEEELDPASGLPVSVARALPDPG